MAKVSRMPRSRDRHGRGIRGPLVVPSPWSPRPRRIGRLSRTDYFNQCVTDSITAIAEFNPRALEGVLVGVEEVPGFRTPGIGDRVPMSAALEGDGPRPAQIVIYERPLEHRASDRAQLARLVHRTIVEQLSALTGLPMEDISDVPDDEDWD